MLQCFLSLLCLTLGAWRMHLYRVESVLVMRDREGERGRGREREREREGEGERERELREGERERERHTKCSSDDTGDEQKCCDS